MSLLIHLLSGQLNVKCVFPFTFMNKTYKTCPRTLHRERNGKPWCSTKVDIDGNHIEGNWGVCDDMEKCEIEHNGKIIDSSSPVHSVSWSRKRCIVLHNLSFFTKNERWLGDKFFAKNGPRKIDEKITGKNGRKMTQN